MSIHFYDWPGFSLIDLCLTVNFEGARSMSTCNSKVSSRMTPGTSTLPLGVLQMLMRHCLQAKVHPEQPGYSVDRETFERIWFHSVDLLQRGFKSGSILTVDPEDARKLGKPWTRR